MSFFETASLVYIADFAAASASAVSGSGNNTGKAYSIKPTDGSGDFDFERGSDITATRVNSSGLIEKGRGNFLLQSNNFDTTWAKSNSSVTSGQSGYDGSNNAWLLETTAASGILAQTTSILGVHTFSFYAKKGTVDYAAFFAIESGGLHPRAWFNLSNGTIPNSNHIIDATISDIGGGWYRCSATFNKAVTIVRIYPTNTSNAFAVGAGENIYIQDAQLEQGLVATDYIETTTAPLRAGLLEDEPRFDYHNSASATPNTCPSLLLEPERTNLIDHSEYFEGLSLVGPPTLTLEDISSPEGVANAYSIVKRSATDNSDRVQQSLGGLGTNHVFSIFLKLKSTTDTFNVRLANNAGERVEAVVSTDGTMVVGGSTTATNYDIENYGNGWYRLWMETTTDATSNFYQLFTNITNTSVGECYFYGAQAEEGSYPTSYIPTYGTAATRVMDYAESSTSLSIGGSEFCAYYEIDTKIIPRESSNTFFRIEFGSNSHFIGIKGSSNSINNMYTLQTLGNYSETMGNVTEIGVVKFLINYSNGVGDLFVNSTKYASVISGPATGNTINNAELRGSGYSHDCKQLLLFPTSLSDDDCATLTTL